MIAEAFETIIVGQMTAHNVPGLAIALVRAGEIVYERGFGVTSVEAENALPVTAQTLFRAGSVTKPMTATMLMRLVEEGLLDLDAPIGEYDSTLRLSDPAATQTITLRMLLSHTSGLPSDLEYHDRRTQRQYLTDLEQYPAERLPRYPFIAPPGTGFFYSNPGINLAARLGEIVTGRAYPQLMEEYVFQPLGMSRTTFDPLEAMTYPLAQGHVRDEHGTITVKRPFIDNPMDYPSGFALTTVHDLSVFALAQLGNGRLSKKVIEPMHRLNADQYNGEGYGLGFRMREYRGQRFVGHNGAIGKFGAVLALLPDARCGVVMLFNRAPGFWTAARQITDQALDQLVGEASRTGQSLSLPKNLNLQDVSEDHDKTARDFSPDQGCYLSFELGLIEVQPTQVRINDILTEAASIKRLNEHYSMINGALAERYDTPLIEVDVETLLRYRGIYDADIDRWIVRVGEGSLLIYSEDDRIEVRAIPITETRFASDFGILDFECEGEAGQALSLVCALGYRFDRSADIP